MSSIPSLTTVVPNDWNSLMRFTRDVQKYLSTLAKTDGTLYTSELILTSALASRLLATDASQKLTETDLVSWISGTENEINITDNGDGTVTIGIVNPLVISKGGTGAETLTDHGLLLGSGTDPITALNGATNGQIPIGSTGVDPVLASITAGEGIEVTNGAGSISIASLGTTMLFDAGTSDVILDVLILSADDSDI